MLECLQLIKTNSVYNSGILIYSPFYYCINPAVIKNKVKGSLIKLKINLQHIYYYSL
jgi:hypothetical protein